MKEEIIIFENIEFYKIPYTEGYYVSKSGKVYSSKQSGKILKHSLNNWGYKYVVLIINKKRKTISIHRLVAITFLGLPVDSDLNRTSKLTVNHINENKADNRLENLEVVTQRENKLHSTKNKLGVKGVSEVKNSITNPYESKIRINNKVIYLGVYPTKEIASQIYQLAIKNIHLYNGNNKEFRELILLNFNKT